ncbi:MAG: aminotransferase class I/II-fold pyridoxal phosphate-dependent enzyme, partial [Actinobacteria bacterium]|nr:aminotransferase class I/II-fold pyridoxal phosphate-dependent enzyme [Actinomycetota bacterium]
MPEQYQAAGHTAAAIAEDIERAVAMGELRPGDPLPSVRRLAAACGVSPGTAAAALADLRRRGLAATEPRRGARVAPRPVATGRPAVPLPRGTRDLARGNPDPALLPDLGRALARLHAPTRLYGEPAVLPALARRARVEFSRAGLPADAPLAVVAGALDGVERALGAALRPGDRVGVEDPGYAALLDLVRGLGLVPEPMAMDDRGVLPEVLAGALAGGVRAVVLTPRGQNPTGAALSPERAVALRAALAAGPPVLAIEDDHLGDVAGAAHRPVAPAAARWVVVRSMSKALGPDLRCAPLTGDPDTIERIARRQLLGPGWVPHLIQGLVAALLGDRAARRAAPARDPRPGPGKPRPGAAARP